MESQLISGESRTSRHVSDSRKSTAKSARFKPRVVTSSKSDSSLKVRWKSGAMNMSFTCDDDFPNSNSLTDNDDVFHCTVTSVKSDFYPGMYHKAVSRRKSQIEDDLVLVDELPYTPLTPEDMSSSLISNHKMEIKSSQDAKISGNDVPVFCDSVSRTNSFEQVGAGFNMIAASMAGRETRYESYDSAKQDSLLSINKAENLGEYESTTDKSIVLEGDENGPLTIHPSNESNVESRSSQLKINTNLLEIDRSDSRTNSPERKRSGRPKSRENRQTSSPGYRAGIEAVIGESVPLSPISDCPSEIEGVETAFGPDTAMSEVVEARYTSGSTNAAYSSVEPHGHMKTPTPSAGAGRRRKSLKAFFRVGLFTAKAKRQSSTNDDLQSSDISSPPPTNRRLVQRRVSRLEMNEPIEDIFSEVTFKTMENRCPSYDDTRDEDSSDCDEIEDPDVILQSYMNGQVGDDEETFEFKGIDEDGSHDNDDVTDSKEHELLLPEICSRNDSTDEPLTSETDLR